MKTTIETLPKVEDIPEEIVTQKGKKAKLGKSAKKIGILILILGILGIVGHYTYKHFFTKKASAQVTTAVAQLGNVEVTISGSGIVEANSKYDVTSLVKGEVISANFEEGAIVSQGQLLYQIDTKDVQNNIEKSKLAVEKAQSTYNQTMDNFNKLTVNSNYSGVVTNVYVKVGDSVVQNGKICDVVNSSEMILKIPFIDDDADHLSVGQLALVTIQTNKISGSVSNIGTGVMTSNDGIPIKMVEIKVDNPGSIKKDDKATALVGDIACNDVGTFDYSSMGTITSDSAGKINNLFCQLNDTIQYNAVVCTLSSDALEVTKSQNSLSVKDTQLSLESEYSHLDDYNIKAPISGTIIQKTIKKGDLLDTTNTKVVMATISDLSKIIFKMDIDELDIDKIQVGQEVTITADALPDKTFTGSVDYKSIVGATNNGVTTYPVTVVINEPNGLIPGMNVSAKVIVSQKENVLRIPVSALKRGNTVTVKDSSGTTQKNQDNMHAEDEKNANKMQGKANDSQATTASNVPSQNSTTAVPDGFKTVSVKTGLNDKDYIEITQGLKEGDIVLVPTVKSTNSQQGGMMAPSAASSPAGGGGNNGGPPAGVSTTQKRSVK